MIPLLPVIVALAYGPPVLDDTSAPKASMELESDEESWEEPGIRVGLGYAIDNVAGVESAPDGLHHSAVLRVGVRLDPRWSLLAGFRYGLSFGNAGGLRFGGTIEPTLELGWGLSLGVGLGLGGFLIGSTGAETPYRDVAAPLTLPSSGPRLASCTGTGVLALVRLEKQLPLSSLIATGPSVQLDAQWTECTQSLNRSDPDTGEPIELHQFWETYGVSVAWMFWWR